MNLEIAKKIEAPTHHQLESAKTTYAFLADIRHEWPGRNTDGGQQLLSYLRDLIADATGQDHKTVQDNGSISSLFNKFMSLDELAGVVQFIRLHDADNFDGRLLNLQVSGATIRILRSTYAVLRERDSIKHLMDKMTDYQVSLLLNRCVVALQAETEAPRAAVRVLDVYRQCVPGLTNAMAGYTVDSYQALLENVAMIIYVCWTDPRSATATAYNYCTVTIPS